MIVAGNIDRAQRQMAHESLPLSTAHAATARAAELAGSLLGFARGRPGTPAWVTMSELVRQFEPIMNGVLFPHAQLRVEVEPDLPTVWADRAQVEQMLLNLVTNARDATGERGQVSLKVSKVDGARCHLLDQPSRTPHLAISVTDNGTGMSPDVLAQVWEPFFSSKAPSEHSGTGLGLSTVHGLAHQHGGHVFIDTVEGRGSTVTIYLPLPATR
jgi:signal transduction histidine kinase